MSRKLRLAAIMFLAATVLAGGAAGTWYVTTGGGHTITGALAPDRADGLSAGRHESGSGQFAEDDLDAVASAWARPADDRPHGASTIARSATMATSPDDRFAALPAADDRYGFAAAADAPSERDGYSPIPMHEAAERHGSPAADAALVTTSRSSETTEPSLGHIELPAALARGQEPTDERATEHSLRAIDDSNDEAAALTEPQPIQPDGRVVPMGSAARRSDEAAEAFDARPASASGDRYGAPSDTGEELASLGGEPRAVNPFGAQAMPNEADIEPLEPVAELPQQFADGNAEPTDGFDELNRERSEPMQRAAAEPDDVMSEGRSGRAIDPPARSEIEQSRNGDPSGSSEGNGRPGERALEGPQRPALEIQKFAPAEIQVGKAAKFVVQVRNVGNQAADGVVVRDEVPYGTRLVSTSPAAEQDAGQLVWQLGKLSPGEDRTLEMQLMPTEEGEIGSVATVTYSAQASAKTLCTMPQLAIRMTAPSKVLVGHEQRVKIELRNPGSGDATGVMLFENVPENLRHPAGPALEFEIGTLRAGETRELELALLAEKAGPTTNVLTARADGNLQVQQQVEFEVIAPALAVDIEGPERRYLERPATYEVRIENPGTAPAQHVQIVTKLPKGLRFIRANNLGEYDAATHAVYWSLDELPEGERGVVELVAMPVETGPQTLQVEGRAGQGLTDQVQRQIVIEGLAAIRFEVRDLEDPIEVGNETTYEIRVVNQGTKAATNVQIAVQLPPGLKYLSAEGETQHVADRSGVVFEPIAQLAPKADTLYRVQVQSTQPGDQRVTVEVVTDDLAQPIRREESTRVFGDD